MEECKEHPPFWPAVHDRGAVMDSYELGSNGPVVSRVGFGCLGMSDFYGPADEAESIATIHAALDAGITLLDTGDFYGMGHNELLIREALRHRERDSVFIQVKFGAQRDPGGVFIGHDARPAAVKTSLAYTLTRLGTDYVDLYQPARLDPNVPIEETVGAIAELVQAGYVHYIGLSEVGTGTIRRAHEVHPITAVQMEYSLMSRTIEAEILPTEMREPTSGLEPLTCSLRVIGQALQGFAVACKYPLSKGISLLCLASCCTVLRSRWYQSG